MFECVKSMSQFSIIARKSSREKVNMEEDMLKDLLQDYFKDSFNVVSYVKKGNKCTAYINCNIFSHSDVDSFIKFYEKEINETLKLNFKKKETENMKEPKIQKQFSNQIFSNGLETPPFNFKWHLKF